MAKITFIDPVKSVSGKLSKASTVTFMLRQAATSNAAMLSKLLINSSTPKLKSHDIETHT